jgi:predicted nucleic-acid-binding Zn-ribbon protein
VSALPKFSEACVCPKCGGTDVSAEWIEAGAHWCVATSRCVEKAEHLHRHCRRCHFKWNEAPLDAEAA